MIDWLQFSRPQKHVPLLALLLGLALLIGMPQRSQAHGGGLDAQGCHMERATERYHCHRGGAVTSGMGNVKVARVKSKRSQTKRVYRPIRADFEAAPFRPSVSRGDGICACSRQARCTGPRGGVYCVNGSGNKRYIGR
jgi:hypothetical protein